MPRDMDVLPEFKPGKIKPSGEQRRTESAKRQMIPTDTKKHQQQERKDNLHTFILTGQGSKIQ